MQFSPIILFAYNRPSHLNASLSSLVANVEARESVLYVFSDGPRSKDSIAPVKEVREIIKSISGFAKVVPYYREENWGLAKSVISGVTQVLNEHDRAIIVEDDLRVSPYFLDFMNRGLKQYEYRDRVASLCGYFYPLKQKLPETFFLREADCWGWATWRRGWELFKNDGTELLTKLEVRGLERDFDVQGSYPYTQMLRDQVNGKNNSWAIRWQASLFLADKLTLYPGKSLVANLGFDNSGEHCSTTTVFDTQISNMPIKLDGVAVEENKTIEGWTADYFRRIQRQSKPGFLSRIKGGLRKRFLTKPS